MAQTLLKVDNINVFYGNIHAVKDVSFEVNEGEIVTLIGANGAGKSTTLKTISGLLHPKTGDVLYKGKSIKGVRAHKIVEAGLAQVPEGRHVFLHMTVEENLDMGAYTQPASTIAPNKEKVFELFPRLKERRKQLAGTMSGGEQQMLAMGRALMSNASMLMLDEPSMGLSPLLVTCVALACVLGHVFSCFMGFRGGKAVATSIGVFLPLAFFPLLFSCAACVLVIWRNGFVSLGSLTLVTVLPFALLAATKYAWVPLSLCIWALVVWKHKENIARLRAGTEKSWLKSRQK